jgi:hypothetical protein
MGQKRKGVKERRMEKDEREKGILLRPFQALFNRETERERERGVRRRRDTDGRSLTEKERGRGREREG